MLTRDHDYAYEVQHLPCCHDRLTINVPLFKKMRDIMVFLWDYYF